MKIAFFDLAGCEIPFINQRCKSAGIDVVKTSTAPLDPTHVAQIKDVEILSVFLSKVNESIINALPHLKLISARATGFDHIDLECAKKKGIAVIYLPSYAEQSVAEYTMGVILMLSRRLGVISHGCIHGAFDQTATCGSDLEGKTIGIVGTGKIGRKLAQMTHGFGMNILCYDVMPNPEMIAPYKAVYVSLNELYKRSDIISIHLPYTKDTHHFINTDSLKLFKKGVLFVNAARGPIVDIAAIRQGLKEGIFGGVAMDTFEGENIWIHQDHMLDTAELPSATTFKQAVDAFSLLKFDNVILTPHIAYNSQEAIQRMIETTLADITTFCQKGNCSDRII
jgi:D-lactate dehydrogenase